MFPTASEYRMQSPLLDTFARIAEEAENVDWSPNIDFLIQKKVPPEKIEEDFSKLYSMVIMRKLETAQQLIADGFTMRIPEGSTEAQLVARLPLERLPCRAGVKLSGNIRIHGRTEAVVTIRPNGGVIFSIPSLNYAEPELSAESADTENLVNDVVLSSWKAKNYSPFRHNDVDSVSPKS